MAKKYANYDGTLPTYDKSKLGDMIVAIKAALIAGYKDTKPAGWELLYESQANTNDTTKRIVIRSKAVDSEQKVFEIEDISNIEGSIKCWDSWSGSAGVNLLMQGKINKNSWDNRIEIIADTKFVHLIINRVYTGFGDIEIFNTKNPSTMLLNMQNTGSGDAEQALASSFSPSRNTFIDITKNNHVCRSFCKEQIGYSARIDWKANPIYDVFNGGDTGSKAIGIESPIRATELLKITSNYYTCYGYLPNMVYTDNPITMENSLFVVNGINKKMINCAVSCAGVLSFAVDA